MAKLSEEKSEKSGQLHSERVLADPKLKPEVPPGMPIGEVD